MCVWIDLIGCTISVRDPAIFTFLHGLRLCSSGRSFRDECKSGTTFLEIRSDLASTSSVNF